MSNSKDLDINALLDAGTRARERSYVPYSNFKMGAAVLSDKGRLTYGSLVENISFGLAMCAERVALFSTISEDTGSPKVLALVSERTNEQLTWPCGACLQVAIELGGPDLQIIACDLNGNHEIRKIGEIASMLPHKPK